MAKKLEQAVASGDVKVRNTTSGEVHLYARGNPIVVGPNETATLTPYVKTMADAARVGGLLGLLQRGSLQLV